jgi:cytochrome c-type biogenesis protein CcmE
VKPKHKRLVFVGLGLGLLAVAAALVLTALEDTVVFFQSPTQVAAQQIPPDQRVRVGGLVKDGSVQKGTGPQIRFVITDMAHTVPVAYRGILPDLFREGQGIVVEGRIRDGILVADQVLAKHDENYMPPEVADALKQSGQWQHMKESLEQAGQIPVGSGGR